MERVLQWLVQDLTLERGSAVHWRHQLRGSLQDPIDHSLVSTEQHRSFGGGLCDLKAGRKLKLHSQVGDRRLQGLLEATNDLVSSKQGINCPIRSIVSCTSLMFIIIPFRYLYCCVNTQHKYIAAHCSIILVPL